MMSSPRRRGPILPDLHCYGKPVAASSPSSHHSVVMGPRLRGGDIGCGARSRAACSYIL
nr:MAG TPA: tRNA-splicing ligase RtcB [Caudoviricetes sp.]